MKFIWKMQVFQVSILLIKHGEEDEKRIESDEQIL